VVVAQLLYLSALPTDVIGKDEISALFLTDRRVARIDGLSQYMNGNRIHAYEGFAVQKSHVCFSPFYLQVKEM
jgi:hypothetical protein